MGVTTDEISAIGQGVRGDIKEPYGYCYVASRNLRKRLKKKGVESSNMDIREVCMGWDGSRKIKHYVLVVRTSEVDDVQHEGSIIVDITLDQYCKANYENGDVEVYIGSSDEIDDVNIFNFSNHPYEGT